MESEYATTAAAVSVDRVNTTPNPRMRRTPAHVIFSRLAQEMSHRVRILSVSQNSHSSHLAQHVARAFVVVSFTLEHYLTFHMHSSPTFNSTVYQTFTDVFFTRRFTCADPSNVSFGPVAETHPPTGYEPKDLTEEDNSILVKPMFFHRQSMTSTCDSAQSIATLPPGSDLDDEQIRNTLASPLENAVSSSSHFRESAGKPAAVFSHKQQSSQETLSDRESISSGHQPVQGRDETFFGLSQLEEAARSVLEEQRDHLLAEAKSEILKQECKVDTLNTCIREFQRQAHSNRLEMDYVNYGYEESRGEQARTKNWRWKRKHFEILVSEASVIWKNWRWGELRKCELTNSPGMNWEKVTQLYKKLTSQIQGLQGRMNHMNDSREFQDVESICSGNYPTFPIKRQWFQVLVGCWAATKVRDLKHGMCLVTSGNVFDSPRAVIKSSSTPNQGVLHSWTEKQWSLEVKKEIEGLVQRRDL